MSEDPVELRKFFNIGGSGGLGPNYKSTPELMEENVRDALTGAYNRRFLDEKLNQFTKEGKQFSYFIFDVDHFKDFNDIYGHSAGDAALKHLVNVVNTVIRTGRTNGDQDYLARYGGEEFVAVLNGIYDKNTALAVCEKIRQKVESSKFGFSGDKDIGVTISGGLSIYKPGDTSESISRRADKALYKAKDNGRNKVVIEKENNV
jgi:diguanylate cyclase (GGDEF)-like protein